MFSGDANQESQRLVHGLGIWKHRRDIRFQPDCQLVEAPPAGANLSYLQAPQIVFGPEFVLLSSLSLLHRRFFPIELLPLR